MLHGSDWRIRQVHYLTPHISRAAHYAANLLGEENAILMAIKEQNTLTGAELTAIRNWKPSSLADDGEEDDWREALQGYGCYPSSSYRKTPQTAHYRVKGDEQGASEFKEYLEKMKKEGLEAGPLADYVKRKVEEELCTGGDGDEDEDAGIGCPEPPIEPVTMKESMARAFNDSGEEVYMIEDAMGPWAH